MNALKERQKLRRASRCLTLAVTSGKGGVGKTALAANLAVCLSHAGFKVTLLDADMGLANIDVLLGVVPQRTIEHFFREGTPLEEIAIEGPGGIRLIPAGSGLPELTTLAPAELLRFVESLRTVREQSDVLLIDTSAGIGDHVSRMLLLADRVLLVTWPEPTALVDAYAALKVMRRRCSTQKVSLVINGAADEDEARRVHARIQTAAERFLGEGIALAGFVPRDEAVADAARRQKAVVLDHPHSPASRSLERLALHIAALIRERMRAGVTPSWTDSPRRLELQH